MVEESELDTDVIKRKIGADFKHFVKTSSVDYLERLKNEMASGFHKFYDELNKKVEEELLVQETQQKELHDKIETHEKKIKTITPQIERRNHFKKTILDKLPDLRGKIIVFRFLSKFKTERKVYKENKFLCKNFLAEKLKRKFFNNLKKATILEETDKFEQKIKQKTDSQLRNLQEGLQKQKEELVQLIYKAEEKLKHENRKKVQTKLQLDQIVLRGISALNMKALALSQNSLNDVVKTDYNKFIDKKYSSMMFPDTKTTLKMKKSNPYMCSDGQTK